MNIIFGNQLDSLTVIIILEVILLVDSVALLIKSDKWISRIFFILMSILWVVCIILNFVNL